MAKKKGVGNNNRWAVILSILFIVLALILLSLKMGWFEKKEVRMSPDTCTPLSCNAQIPESMGSAIKIGYPYVDEDLQSSSHFFVSEGIGEVLSTAINEGTLSSVDYDPYETLKRLAEDEGEEELFNDLLVMMKSDMFSFINVAKEAAARNALITDDAKNLVSQYFVCASNHPKCKNAPCPTCNIIFNPQVSSEDPGPEFLDLYNEIAMMDFLKQNARITGALDRNLLGRLTNEGIGNGDKEKLENFYLSSHQEENIPEKCFYSISKVPDSELITLSIGCSAVIGPLSVNVGCGQGTSTPSPEVNNQPEQPLPGGGTTTPPAVEGGSNVVYGQEGCLICSLPNSCEDIWDPQVQLPYTSTTTPCPPEGNPHRIQNLICCN